MLSITGTVSSISSAFFVSAAAPPTPSSPRSPCLTARMTPKTWRSTSPRGSWGKPVAKRGRISWARGGMSGCSSGSNEASSAVCGIGRQYSRWTSLPSTPTRCSPPWSLWKPGLWKSRLLSCSRRTSTLSNAA